MALHELIGFSNLGRICCPRQNLCNQSVRVECNRRDQLVYMGVVELEVVLLRRRNFLGTSIHSLELDHATD